MPRKVRCTLLMITMLVLPMIPVLILLRIRLQIVLILRMVAMRLVVIAF